MSSNETKVTARMDPELKKDAEALLSDMGLTFSTWITLATKALVNEQKIPFEIKASSFYNKRNTQILKQRYKEYQKGEAASWHKMLD